MKCLSMMMTLYDIGFTRTEIEQYVRLFVEGASTEAARIKILDAKRDETLEEIHFKERQLDRLDYLRYKIQKGNETYAIISG